MLFRSVVGPKAAIVYAGLSQMVYLVLFSYSFFLENLTGLTVAIGSVLTLAMLMVLTARIKWGEQMPELERKCRPNRWVPVGEETCEAPVVEIDLDEPPGFAGEQKGER